MMYNITIAHFSIKFFAVYINKFDNINEKYAMMSESAGYFNFQVLPCSITLYLGILQSLGWPLICVGVFDSPLSNLRECIKSSKVRTRKS